MPVPNFVSDGLVLHLHAAKATGSGKGTNSPATTVWKDISGNGFDAVLKQFAYTDESGWNSDCLMFDGVDDYVQITSNGIGKFDYQEFTIEAFVTPGDYYRNVIFTYDYSVGAPYYCTQLRLAPNGNTPWFFFYINVDGTSRSIPAAIPTGIDTTKPMHVVATFKSEEQKIYVNNIVKATNTYAGTVGYVANNVQIGKSYDAATKYSGKVHILRYYRRALSPAEVTQNYNAGIDWLDANIATATVETYAAPLASGVGRYGAGERYPAAGIGPVWSKINRSGLGNRSGAAYVSSVRTNVATLARALRAPVSYVREVVSRGRLLQYLNAASNIIERKKISSAIERNTGDEVVLRQTKCEVND